MPAVRCTHYCFWGETGTSIIFLLQKQCQMSWHKTGRGFLANLFFDARQRQANSDRFWTAARSPEIRDVLNMDPREEANFLSVSFTDCFIAFCFITGSTNKAPCLQSTNSRVKDGYSYQFDDELLFCLDGVLIFHQAPRLECFIMRTGGQTSRAVDVKSMPCCFPLQVSSGGKLVLLYWTLCFAFLCNLR